MIYAGLVAPRTYQSTVGLDRQINKYARVSVTYMNSRGVHIQRSRNINAPIDGTIIARKIGPGQYVRSDSGDPLYAIADMTTMWLKVSVPESDVALVRVGQQIEASVAAVPDRVFRARVIALAAAADPATRRATSS